MIAVGKPIQLAIGFVMVWMLLLRALVCINSRMPLPPPHVNNDVHPPYYAN